MKTFSLIGIIIVQLALVCYSIAIITEQRKKLVSVFVLSFLTAGVVFDIIATSFMILGSSRGLFTVHGTLGYSSLLGMFAYIWWIIAYITGALLVALRHA